MYKKIVFLMSIIFCMQLNGMLLRIAQRAGAQKVLPTIMRAGCATSSQRPEKKELRKSLKRMNRKEVQLTRALQVNPEEAVLVQTYLRLIAEDRRKILEKLQRLGK